MTQYCLNNPTPDCSCVERSKNKTYNTLRLDSSINDGCWWKPCGDPNTYLVPPNIVRGTTNCDSVLSQIATKINRQWSRLDCCDLQDFVIYAPNGTEENINCVFTEAGESQLSWFEEYGWWISLIVLIIVLLLLATLFYSYVRPSSTSPLPPLDSLPEDCSGFEALPVELGDGEYNSICNGIDDLL
jgi:hypothetical protein